MFNKIIILGNLTRDIELRYLPSGTALANTAIATSRKFKDKAGENQEETCFVDLTIFGKTAEVANQYLKRGSKVLIEGRLKFEQWTDKDGGKKSKHKVAVESLKMLGTKEDKPNQEAKYYEKQRPVPPMPPKKELPEIDIDDEIPF